MNTKENKQSWMTPKRVFIGMFSLSALGIGYWALTRNSNKPGSDTTSLLDENSEPPVPEEAPKQNILPKSNGGTIPQRPASDFPIRKGSRGEKVKVLQQTLNAKYPGLLVADGIYGSKTESALKSKGLPTEITEQQFAVLTAVDPQVTVDTLYNAVSKKDFKQSLSAIQAIKSPSEYSAINEKFKAKRLNGVSTTIVTGMLAAFPSSEQKDQLNIAFTTMGLEKKDGKWTIPVTISGVRKHIVTTRPTKIWQNVKHMVQVGNHTILGWEVKSGDGITRFDTVDGYRLNVMTAHVKYI